MASDILIRPANPDDPREVAFIQETWKNSWRTCPYAGTIRNDRYYDTISDTIENLVVRGATFSVACSPARPNYVLAWACTEVARDGKCIVHYLYCKDAYLGSDARTLLIEAAAGQKPGFFSHHYRTVVESCPRRDGWRWAPEAARRK